MTIDPFGGEAREGQDLGTRRHAIQRAAWRRCSGRFGNFGKNSRGSAQEIWFAGLDGRGGGARRLHAFAKQDRGDFALIGEPTRREIVYTHKGSPWLKLTTCGRAVHASAPGRGVNAIYKMADVMGDPEWSSRLGRPARHPMLGVPTISAGTIQRRHKVNIVPDFCEPEVDSRTIPGQESAVSKLIAELRAVCPDWKSPGARSRSVVDRSAPSAY